MAEQVIRRVAPGYYEITARGRNWVAERLGSDHPGMVGWWRLCEANEDFDTTDWADDYLTLKQLKESLQ